MRAARSCSALPCPETARGKVRQRETIAHAMVSNVWTAMLRRFCWCLLLLLYWAIVVHFLRAASPVFTDGGGPMPSFHWGDPPLPGLGEYTRHQSYYDRIYSLPYYLAGLVLTFIGCSAAPLIVRRSGALPSHAFRNAAGTTLVLVVLLAIASDIGTLLRVWRGPVFLLHRSHGLFSIWALCKALLPACILSGVVAVGKAWVAARQLRPPSARFPT